MNVWRDGTSGSASSALTPFHAYALSRNADIRGVTLNSLKSAIFTTCSRAEIHHLRGVHYHRGQFIFLFNLFWSMKLEEGQR